jgi:tetratricopeptide (TPR) repeat protein
MSAEGQVWIKKATELRNEGRVEESIIAARKATSMEPASPNAWWQLALSIAQKDGDGTALNQFKKTVELSPEFATGWHRLGLSHSKLKQTQEAEEAWLIAVDIDAERQDSLRELLRIYRERKAEGDDEKFLNTLKKLEANNALTSLDLNSLAVAYHKKNEFLNAIPFYKRYLAERDDQWGYFNIGLAYSDPSISQDVDAIDSWRQSLRVNPEYDKPLQSIAKLMPKLLDLRSKVLASRENASLLSQEQRFANYINPFQLLNLYEVLSPHALDLKEIQRAKNALIHEIQLEDGLVPWIPGLTIDRSRVIQVSDELFDETKKEWHFIVFQNKELLDFLSNGSIDLFLIHESLSPLELLQTIEQKDGFTGWLSPRFATQYNQVFAKALEVRNADIIEAMMDGRRWVLPEHEDICFESAVRQCEKLLEPLRKIKSEAEVSKPSLRAVKIALEIEQAGKILKLLPASFHAVLSEAASLVRSISISTNNAHHDADLAKAILALANDFATRAPTVRMKIEQDAKTLDEIIQREKKDESFLTFNGNEYSITREGAKFADRKLLASEVEKIRWGIVNSRTGEVQSQEYTLVLVGPSAKTLSLNWISTRDKEKNRDLFFNFVSAVEAYILPTLIENITYELKRGATVYVGGFALTKAGVTFRTKGWFKTKEELCPWKFLKSEISRGDVLISDSANPNLKITLPLIQIDNAWVLHQIVKNGF